MKKKVEPERKNRLTVLKPEDVIRFNCKEKLDCYTRCCRDITIFLTPYDVLRMKNALQISSSDFLAGYTTTLIGDIGCPVCILKMQDGEATAKGRFAVTKTPEEWREILTGLGAGERVVVGDE